MPLEQAPISAVTPEQSAEASLAERKALTADFDNRKRQHLKSHGRQSPASRSNGDSGEAPEVRQPLVLEVRDMENSRRRAARATGKKPAFEVWHAGKPINRVEAPAAPEVEVLPAPDVPPPSRAAAPASHDLRDDTASHDTASHDTAAASGPVLPEIEARPVQELAVPQSAVEATVRMPSRRQNVLRVSSDQPEVKATEESEPPAYSKEDAVEMLRQARQLAHSGSYESATWLVLRAQQVGTWTNHDVLTPDAMLLEIQGLRSDDSVKTSKARPAPAPAPTPVIVNVPSATAPVVMKLDWSDVRVPATTSSLVIGFGLLLLVGGGALLAMVFKIMRTMVSTVFRVDMPPVQIQMNGVPTMGVPQEAGYQQPASEYVDDYDPADMDVPENPMVFPMAFAGTSFADQETQRLEEERQCEVDLVKCIFEKNMQLQEDLSQLEAVA